MACKGHMEADHHQGWERLCVMRLCKRVVDKNHALCKRVGKQPCLCKEGVGKLAILV